MEPSTRTLGAGPTWLAHWILSAAACSLAGWGLSLVGQLHALGLAVAIPALWWGLVRLAGVSLPPWPGRRSVRIWRRRFARPFAAAFLLLAVLSAIGGFLHAPNNYDALIYRLPRLCHWLMAERWEWIPTIKNNLNTRSTGFEWWMAPAIAWFRTDRILFLLNLVSFLFLPGLFFSLFRSMGVSNRVAALWMWLLPTGYCFVLQAASVGNDMVTALFAVAAFDFGFRWKRGGGFPCMAMALLSCALMTAMKPTTLPLLLPFAVLFFGMGRTVWAKPVRTLALAACCAAASFVPTAAINIRQCGDWTGAAAEDQKLGSVEPAIGLLGNTINASLQNLVPPVFPFANAWNRIVVAVCPAPLLEAMSRSFEPGGARFAVADFTGEESAGAGMGVTLLLLGSAVFAMRRRAGGASPGPRSTRPVSPWLLAALFGAALAAYFSRAGMSTVGRHIAPYYPFLFGIGLLGAGQARLVRSRVWRVCALAAVVTSFLIVLITPSRPLWPARWFFSKVAGDSKSPLVQRARNGYEIYAGRADRLGVLREALPPEVVRVAYLSYSSGAELPLWKPYLRRSLRHVLPSDSVVTLRAEGLTHLIVHVPDVSKYLRTDPREWVAAGGGEVVFRTELQLLAKQPPSEWWVVRLHGPS